ncbi:MAG TPA: hypothetical protein VGC96_12805 [Candidatus Elarobacter sp.]|jgi:hypothetical protein
MLTAQFSMLLAVLGTVLMAIVIFAPAPAGATVTASFAPPLEPPPFHRWEPSGVHPYEVAAAEPQWPRLVDPRAAGCDADGRNAIVAVLAELRSPWSREILARALEDESDAAVRDAIADALAR